MILGNSMFDVYLYVYIFIYLFVSICTYIRGTISIKDKAWPAIENFSRHRSPSYQVSKARLNHQTAEGSFLS